jgi:hypothetical protein
MRSPLRGIKVCIVLAGVLLGTAIAAGAPPVSPTASRAELERWFRSVQNSHVVMAAQHDWQYSFAAADGRALEALSVALVRDGYAIVALEGGSTPMLRMAKVELHSPSTLLQRNKELQQIARRHGARYAGVVLKD